MHYFLGGKTTICYHMDMTRKNVRTTSALIELLFCLPTFKMSPAVKSVQLLHLTARKTHSPAVRKNYFWWFE